MKLSNRHKLMITFSDAMNAIDKSRDYNEYSEINSSQYFKDTLNNAEDEINKMMSSPLISNYRRYKRTDKMYRFMFFKNKDYIFNKIYFINEDLKKEKKREKEYQMELRKKKYKVNPTFERLSKIKINFSNTKTEANEAKDKKNVQKLLLTSSNIPFFPKINKNFNGTTMFNKPFNKKRNFEDYNSKYFSKTHDKNLNLINTKEKLLYSKSKKSLKNIYNNCLKSIEKFETNSQEKIDIKFSSNMKLEKPKPLENRLYNDDTEMNKYLSENINIFIKNNQKKKVNIAKQLRDLRLKKDPILQLSEKFAYLNRKPLLQMFCNTDEENSKGKKGPLLKLRIKDQYIMDNLEKDNRTKNLLMKRLEEDQIKYKKGGYFFVTEEDEEENINDKDKNKDKDKDKNKDKKTILNKIADIEQETINIQSNDNINDINKPGYESQRNILIK